MKNHQPLIITYKTNLHCGERKIDIKFSLIFFQDEMDRGKEAKVDKLGTRKGFGSSRVNTLEMTSD